MCFNTGVYCKEEKPKPKKAKKDITVWKCITENGYGAFYNLTDENGDDMKWEQGFHYTELPDEDGNVFNILRGNSWLIWKGLHSKKRKDDAEYGRIDSEIVVKMIIPKGALYFENDEEYVSDQLIYPKQKIKK